LGFPVGRVKVALGVVGWKRATNGFLKRVDNVFFFLSEAGVLTPVFSVESCRKSVRRCPLVSWGHGVCGRIPFSHSDLSGWEVVQGLRFLWIAGAEARFSPVRGAMKAYAFGQKYK